ncbi:MAG: division/cell wall cluster transcriptional repressor MraZ [Synergistaceae bacterium]|jgi:MraZ protein|nr:division/cell wall cluster transcriptional repressor MraZ [Synergistaceae bacterium]
MGLIGNFDHKLDAKGRLVLPACFRDELGPSVVAAVTGSQCISIYSEKSWSAVIERLEELSVQSSKGDDIQRRILANSYKVEIDSMGRVLIPEKLRAFANIVQDVCINGKNKKLEIWDLSRWRNFMSESEKLVPEISALIPGL